MNLLRINNGSCWTTGCYSGWDANLRFQLTLIIKQSYSFDLNGEIYELTKTEPIIEYDQYRSSAEISSLDAVHETMPYKANAEWYGYGDIRLPDYCNNLDIAISVACTAKNLHSRKCLRVFKPRHWQASKFGYKATYKHENAHESEHEHDNYYSNNKCIKLCYENAFGGHDHPSNPAGVGYLPHSWERSLYAYNITNNDLPSIEQGPNWTHYPGQIISPAGIGPIAPHWQPRKLLFEKCNKVPYEDAYTAPYNKCEQLYKLHQVAPADQQLASYLSKQIDIAFENCYLAADRPLLRLHHELVAPELVQFSSKQLTPRCDTLIIELSKQKFHLIWRAALEHDLRLPLPNII